MSSVSALTNGALQQTVNQILSTTSAQDASGTNAPTSTASTTVSLGNGVATPLTYNSRGQMSSTQLAQLEQAVATNLNNTLSSLFSANPGSSGASNAPGGVASGTP